MPDNINSHLNKFPEKNTQGQSQATEAKSVGSFWVRGKARAAHGLHAWEILIYLFSSPGRAEHAEVCIWSNASFTLSATQRLGKRGRLSYYQLFPLVWLHSGGGVHTRGREGRQAVMLVAWLEGAGEGFKAMTWELVQRRKLRGNPFFPPTLTAQGLVPWVETIAARTGLS